MIDEEPFSEFLGYIDAMIATLLVLMTLGQAADPARFMAVIVGLGDPTRETLEITVSPTPFGSVSGVEVASTRLAPLPTREDRQPRAILPLRTEATPTAGLRAWFTPPGRRFHLVVTLSDGSTHTIDIYRPVPPAEAPTPRLSRPTPLIAPRGMWTTDRSRDHIGMPSSVS